MKKSRALILLSAVLMLASSSLFAQGKYGPDSAECVKYLNFYQDYYKQQNWKDAASNWRKAVKFCPPKVSQNMFIRGRVIMKYLIDNYQGTAEGKKVLIDSLVLVSEIRAKNFPKKLKEAEEAMAFDMIGYFEPSDRRVYDALDNIIKHAGADVNPDLIVAKMDRARMLYEAKVIGDEDVLNTYSNYSPMLESIVKADPSDVNLARQKVFENAFIASGVANCENLVKVFQPRFEANPNDKDIVKSVAKVLSDANCVDEELFIKSVIALHSLEPSFNSARLLYRLHAAKNEHEVALKYLQEAIDSPESGDKEDADMLFEMATYYYKNMGNNGRAVASARAAVEKNSELEGKSNLLIGTIWYQVKCSGNEIEQRAKFWVAADYLQRAKNADPALASEVDDLLANCRAYYPKTEDAFMYDLTDGKPFTVSCSGMSATTTVRTQK